MALPDPVSFPIQPAIKGLHTELVPVDIDIAESPALMNVRFTRGQIVTRNGFKGKYFGAKEPIILSEYLWTLTGSSTLMAISLLNAYYESGTKFKRIPLYTGNVATKTIFRGGAFNYFQLLPAQWFSLDVGKCIYTPYRMHINNGSAYPGSGDYGDATFLCSEADGIFILINASYGPEGQVLTGFDIGGGTPDPVPTNARAIATMDGRAVLGGPRGSGVQLYAHVQWSAKGEVSKWATAYGGGSVLVGDDAEYIQQLAKLGEFLLVYKEGSVHIGRKTDLLDPAFSFQQLHSIGLAAPRSIGDMGTEHIFLGWDNVYILNLQNIKSVADKVKQELLYGPDGITQKYYSTCFGTTAAEFDEYWLFVPTGKIPEYADGTEIYQLAPNPTFLHEEFEGDVSTANNTLLNCIMESGDVVGTRIPTGAVDTISGWGLTADRTVSSVAGTTVTLNGGNGDRTILDSKFTVIPSSNGFRNSWKLDGGGAGTLVTVSGGNFGGQFVRYSRTSGTIYLHPYGIAGAVHFDLGSIDVHEVSAVVWLKVAGACSVDITIDEQNAGGVSRGATTRTIVFTGASEWAPYIVSRKFTNGSADSRYFDIRIGTPSNTGVNVDVDAVSVVDLYKSSSKYVEDKFIYTEGAYRALGYIGPDGAPQLIPMFINKIAGYIADTLWVYNYSDDSWTKWRLPVAGQGYDVTKGFISIAELQGLVTEQTWKFDEKLVAAAAPSNLLGGLDGQFYEISKKYNYDWEGLLNRPLLSYWQSKDFTMGQPYTDKTLSRVSIYHEVSHPAVDVEIGASTDSGATWTNQTVTIRSGRNETFADFFVVGTNIRFRIRAAVPFAVSGWSVKIIARGEANAY